MPAPAIDPYDFLTPKFDPKATWVNFTEAQLKLIAPQKSDFGFFQQPFPSGHAVSVDALLTSCGRELLFKLGMMIAGDALPVRPPEWKDYVAALLQAAPLPAPPKNPVQEIMRRTLEAQSPRQTSSQAKPNERMTTPLYDEIVRARKDLDDHYPGALTPEEEDRLDQRLANFHGDEIRNWHDERHKDLYPEPRVSRAELERRSREILAEFAIARTRSSSPPTTAAPQAEPRPIDGEDGRADRQDLPRQPDEISLSDAANFYDIPRATLAKYTKKQPGQLNHLPSRRLGKSRLLKKRDVQNLRRSIQRRNRPDTSRRPLDSDE